MPGNNVEMTSAVDVYLIDVRNGFIYSLNRNQTQAEKRFVRIGHRKHNDELIKRNNSVLIQSVVGGLERVLKNESYIVNSE